MNGTFYFGFIMSSEYSSLNPPLSFKGVVGLPFTENLKNVVIINDFPLSVLVHILVTQVNIPLRCLNSTTWVTVLLPTCLVTCQLTATLEGQVVTLPTHGNTTTLVLGGLPQLVGGSFCYVVSVNVRSFYDKHGIYRFNLWHLLN